MEAEERPITRFLNRLDGGDPEAGARVLELVYDELHRVAEARMANEAPGNTLQPTALVNEAYLRLVGDSDTSWENRRHFYGAAAEAMRRILVDRARSKQSLKRGGGGERVPLEDRASPFGEAYEGERLFALDAALHKLEETDGLRSELVKLRFFAGLTIEQAAEAMGIAVPTANLYWRFARAWLASKIQELEGGAS